MNDIVYWVRGAEYLEVARQSIISVRKVYPSAAIFIYTDEAENTLHIDGTIRCTLPPGRPAMVANLDAQLLHLNTAEYGRQVLFLDADTLVKKPVELGPVDMMVTWRKSAGPQDVGGGLAQVMPYNFGVVGAVVSARTREAWMWMRAQVLNMSPDEQTWYGNQRALAALVGACPESGSETKTVPIVWSLRDLGGTSVTVQQHPCETHNFTPQAEGEDVSGKFVLHFKANRKQMMATYA